MIPRKFLSLLCAGALLLSGILSGQAQQVRRPKLVVALTIDQFRYDYLTRFQADYTGGLRRLLDRGAVFTNGHYEHFPTVTAIGHATYLSGATPSISGIVGNEWYDRESGKQVTSVSDDSVTLLGGDAKRRGSSPKRLLVSTIPDELKMANGQSKAIGISSKDRSAILPVGRMADGAYWFDTSTGNFVSSTYYFRALPAWAEAFNQSRKVDQWVGKEWAPIDSKPDAQSFGSLGKEAGKSYYDRLDRSPFSNDLLIQFAQAAIEAEGLGADEVPDVLAVSFSANDRIGHSRGPDAPEVRDISIQTDRLLGRFFDYLDKKIGPANYLVTLTADHGVAPLPEVMAKRGMPGGRMPEGAVLSAVQKALSDRWGEGEWVVGKSGPAPYFNYNLLREKKLTHLEVQQAAAEAVRSVPHIARVYTKTELRDAKVLHDLIDRRVANGFHFQRASDLFIVAEPYWLFERSGTSHGTPYNYDTHVPILFMGPGVKAGRYHVRAAVNDIAPTLATMLDVEIPSGATGRVLHEMLQ